MSGKIKFPRADAMAVAAELCRILKPVTDRLIVAGSLRRRKQEVGDVEILYIPKRQQFQDPDELLPRLINVNVADAALATLLVTGVLAKRLNMLGSETWGEKNKLAIHRTSLIPVDFFAATDANWWNYLVCRTGSAEHNTKLAMAAQARGWKWNPYGSGFMDERGNLVRVASENDVFTFLGLPYLEPWQRI